MLKNKIIYELVCPIENQVRYIGRTTNPKNRLRQHCDLKHNSNLHNLNKGVWINNLLQLNLKPELLIIDEVPANTIGFWELHYIDLYKSYGFNLLNGTIGLSSSTSFKKK